MSSIRHTATVLTAVIVIGVLGRSIELVLPLLLNGAGRDLGLSNTELGIFAGAELAGITACSGLVFLLRLRVPPVLGALIGTAALGLANALTAHATTSGEIAVLRFAAGLLGEGVLLVVAIELLGAAANTSRVYAAFMASQMVFGAVALVGLGQIDMMAGFSGMMTGCAVVCLLGLIAVPFLPKQVTAPKAVPMAYISFHSLAPWRALGGMLMFHIGVSAIWAFLQQKGTTLDIDTASSSRLLGLMMFSGIIGTYWVMRHKQPRAILSLTCAAFFLAGSTAALTQNVLPFAFAGMTLMIAWNISVPHQIALLGQLKEGAVYLSLVPAAQGIGLAAGPVLAGLFTNPGEYLGLAVISLFSSGTSAWFFVTTRQAQERTHD